MGCRYDGRLRLSTPPLAPSAVSEAPCSSSTTCKISFGDPRIAAASAFVSRELQGIEFVVLCVGAGVGEVVHYKLGVEMLGMMA